MKCWFVLSLTLALCYASPAPQDMSMGMGMGMGMGVRNMMMQRMKRESLLTKPLVNKTTPIIPAEVKEPSLIELKPKEISTRNTMSMTMFRPANMGMMKRDLLNIDNANESTTTTTTTELPPKIVREILPINTIEAPKPTLPILHKDETPLDLNKEESKFTNQKPKRDADDIKLIDKTTELYHDDLLLNQSTTAKPKRATLDASLTQVKPDGSLTKPVVNADAVLNKSSVPLEKGKLEVKPALTQRSMEVKEMVEPELTIDAKTGRTRRSSYGSTRASYAVRQAPVVRVQEYSAPAPVVRAQEYSAPAPVVRAQEYSAPAPVVRAQEYSAPAPVVRAQEYSAPAPVVRAQEYSAPAPVVRAQEYSAPAPVVRAQEYSAPAPIVRAPEYSAPMRIEAPVRAAYVQMRSNYEAPAVRSSYEVVREAPMRSAYVDTTAAPIRISMDTYQPTVRESPRYKRSTGQSKTNPKSARTAIKGPMKRKIGPGMMVKMM